MIWYFCWVAVSLWDQYITGHSSWMIMALIWLSKRLIYMWNGILWLGYAMRTSTDMIIFTILNVLSILGYNKRSFYQIDQKEVEQTGFFDNISQYVLTAPRKPCISLILYDGSCSRVTKTHFFQGLSLVGINQYPSQSVSWMDCALEGANSEAIASRQERTLLMRT